MSGSMVRETPWGKESIREIPENTKDISDKERRVSNDDLAGL